MLVRNAGFTLTELMVSIAVGSMLAAIVMTLFTSQSAVLVNQIRTNHIAEDGREVFNTLKRLLQQAKTNPIIVIKADQTVTNSETGSSVRLNNNNVVLTDLGNHENYDEIVIEFDLPPGVPVWPNTTGADYKVRIRWANTGSDAYKIFLDYKKPAEDWGTNEAVLSGYDSDTNTRVLNLDFWPLQNDGSAQASINDTASGGYRLVVTTSMSARTDGNSIVNSFRGTILPRN